MSGRSASASRGRSAERAPARRAAPASKRGVERAAQPTPRRATEHRGLDSPLDALAGVGPARAARLGELGLRSVRDLVLLPPRKLERWPDFADVASAKGSVGARVALRGSIERVRFSRFGGRSLVRVRVVDATGAIDALFFNQSWMRDRFARGEAIELHGQVVAVKGEPALSVLRVGSEQRPFPKPGDWVATYPTVAGLGERWLGELAARAAELFAGELVDPLPPGELELRGLCSLDRAARELHRPTSEASFRQAARRVALESLLALQARIVARARQRTRGGAPRLQVDGGVESEILACFAVEPTGDQLRSLAELRADLARATPMRRLLQGDVGTGKTLVALAACLVAARCGAQAALLAPTEVLAEQHLESARVVCERAGVGVALLCGSMAPQARRRELARIGRGEASLVFGTHALLSEGVVFRRLALAVIDEQHRFGVAQRSRLLEKGRDVHALLLTATPIPRTLALTLYGDLEVSLMREKPLARAPVATRWIAPDGKRAMFDEVVARVAAGERAFWVVPRIGAPGIGESGDEDLRGAEQRFARLSRTALARHGIELVHARMPAVERGARLRRFRDGSSRTLVATTVIEVGVDVPEATIVVIEEAERLGLAQLHQLRGRVGRGAKPGTCFVLGDANAAERLRFFERTDDGFAIAERDLEQRGMGDLGGFRQAGPSTEGLDLERDLSLLVAARELVLANPAVLRAYQDRELATDSA